EKVASAEADGVELSGYPLGKKTTTISFTRDRSQSRSGVPQNRGAGRCGKFTQEFSRQIDASELGNRGRGGA
ncbi:hypothetical protein MTO96_032355, partial [Rhipicephalus appendiculatus]